MIVSGRGARQMIVLAIGVHGPINDTANPLDNTADSIGNTCGDSPKKPATTAAAAVRFPALSVRLLRAGSGRVRIA